jgi:type I restriction enzyme S subunit
VSKGRYSPYPEYNLCDSNSRETKPKHWVGLQIKHALRSASSSGSAIKGSVSNEDAEGLFPAFSASGQDVWTPNWVFDELGIVLSAVGARCGKCFKAEGKWAVVANTHVLLMNDQMNRNFFWYLVNDEEFWQKGGSAQPYIQVPASLSQHIGTPPLDEQTQIAKFLDHATAKIDRLIGRQQELIRLLKEKRQAVISHAVTKGLNPHAPLKDSGIEWLGQVPAHWCLPKVNHIGRVLNGSTPDKSNLPFWTDGTIAWLASSCLNSSRVEEPSELITKLAFANSSVEMIPPGSLLVGMVGQGKTRGSSAVLMIESCINQNLAAIIPHDRIKSDFLYFVFQAMYEDLRELGRGGNQAALNCEIIGAIRIPLPDHDEQRAIASRLQYQLEKFDRTHELAEEQIALLQERRTALISAAVTGKIDVRAWQPPVVSKMETTTPDQN